MLANETLYRRLPCPRCGSTDPKECCATCNPFVYLAEEVAPPAAGGCDKRGVLREAVAMPERPSRKSMIAGNIGRIRQVPGVCVMIDDAPVDGWKRARVGLEAQNGLLILTCAEAAPSSVMVPAALDRERAAFLATLLAEFAETGMLPEVEVESIA